MKGFNVNNGYVPEGELKADPPTGGSGVPPVAGGLRYNSGKAKWSLLDFDSLEPMVRVMEYGAGKYAPHNWKKGMPHTEIADCLMRHLYAYLACDDFDIESKQHHIAHVQANAMFLQYNIKYHPQLDDRYRGALNDIPDAFVRFRSLADQYDLEAGSGGNRKVFIAKSNAQLPVPPPISSYLPKPKPSPVRPDGGHPDPFKCINLVKKIVKWLLRK